MILHDLLERGAMRYGDKPAVIFKGKKLTYNQLKEEAEKIALSLLSLGMKKGDHIAVWMPNNDSYLPVYFGITAIGAVMVPMNTRYRTNEASYILKNSDARTIFMVPKFLKVDYLDMLNRIIPELEKLEYAIIVDGKDDIDMNVKSIPFSKFISYGKGNDISDFVNGVEENDISQILYTSGTTGKPKGVMLTHKNVCTNAVVTGEIMEVTPDDRYFIPLPIFHSFGLVLGCLTPLAFGSSIVLQDIFDAGEALHLMQKYECTMNFGVPTMFAMELEEFRKGGYSLKLRSGMMGGAPCPVEVVKGVRAEMGCDVCIGYGITETSPLISLTRYDDDNARRTESVGKPLPGVDVKVVDEARKELPHGSIGEIAVRGNVMKGYYKMPEETKKAVDGEGWYYSGDLGKIDEHGYVYITGRKKDMIVVGGFNVYPREVEELLFVHPKVKNVAAVGVPDNKLGEAVKVFVIPDGEVKEEEIKEFCKQSIANFKVPKYVEFIDEFPITASGKIQKYKLREKHGSSKQ
ncbi:MAG: long-chain-fatty-acid--CoA ligase [Candidatus Thermoplasmatota archaeon]|nr:long-chain-fatty-acid--CoA ligase [Candidatus Thermoplasmatota archaeon]